MNVLGMILKILLVLLKILLVLVLILLVLLLTVLLLPLSYEVTGKADSEQGLSGVDARALVKYGFGLLNFRLRFSGGDLTYALKLAGKTLKKGGRRKPEEEEGPGPEEETPAGPAEEERPAERPPEQADRAEPAASKTESKKPEPEKPKPASPPKAERKKEEDLPEKEYEPGPEEEREPLGDRIARLNEKREELWDKLLDLWDKLQDPAGHKTVSRVMKAVGRILRRVLPDVFRGKVLFGTGDPASTGKILGAFYALYPIYGAGWDLALSGNFEEKCLKGKVYLAGKFRLMGILTPVLALLRDRNIRKLLIKWWKNR